MNRIGVLGGTFDPLHLGHLRAAEVVRDALALDEVLFVPAATPPHKSGPAVTEAHHRLRMVEAALGVEPWFAVSRVEIERGGPSYTIDTLALLASARPDTRFYFVTGSDAFVEIRTWSRWRELLSRYSFVVHERPGFPLERAKAVVAGEPNLRVVEGEAFGVELRSDRPEIFLVRRPMLNVSSTEIRRSVREKRSIRYLVPEAVAAYIRENRLYE